MTGKAIQEVCWQEIANGVCCACVDRNNIKKRCVLKKESFSAALMRRASTFKL